MCKGYLIYVFNIHHGIYKEENYVEKCCGLQIRPVEEQLEQRVIGKRYRISRKKEVIQRKY